MAMKTDLILTAVGPDQVGLVEKISKFISRHGCNIEDSKMAVFCGEFAVIALISGDPADILKTSRDYREIETETGLSIIVKTPSEKRPAQPGIRYKLTASCMDHPGIVYDISQVITGLGVNIESMETRTYSAPMSGTPLFELHAELLVPLRTDLSRFRETLVQLQIDKNIDIDISVSTLDLSKSSILDGGKTWPNSQQSSGRRSQSQH